MKAQTSDFNFFHHELKEFVYKKVKDKSLAEDIVQDVFLKAQNKMQQLQHGEKITNWIYKIAKNVIIDHFRRQSKAIRLHDLDWESNSNLLNECASGCLTQMLLTLPQKYREAIELAEIGDLSQTALAIRLGISYSAAKSRVQRARQMLKDKMERHYLIKTDAYGNVIVCETKRLDSCSIC